MHSHLHPMILALATLATVVLPATAQATRPAGKALPLPGEVFAIEGRTAFLIAPSSSRTEDRGRTDKKPWVWYAPSLPAYPSKAEAWLFRCFLDQGIAIAGIDVGESNGNPAGRAHYTALYRELVTNRDYAERPCMLARSRGGLMLYNWAADNPKSVACIAGIYPVTDLRTWPGLAKAAPSYDMTAAELTRQLSAHNPIDRLAPLATAGVPIFHLHGKSDHVVPFAWNASELKRRYEQLGGSLRLRTIHDHGHDLWRGWFENQELVDFVITHALTRTSRRATTKNRIRFADAKNPDPRAPADAQVLVGRRASALVPENDEVDSHWVFNKGILTASPKSDSVITSESYRDFRIHLEFNVNTKAHSNPERNGNSGVYIQQRYEVQILDSHGIAAEDYKASYCGSIYRQKKPDQLVSKPAGEWQSYDIVFRAARFTEDTKTANARITVYQNQVMIHDDYELQGKTGAGKPEGPGDRPIKLQGHGNKVRFRNVWIQRLDLDLARAERPAK